MHYQWKSLWTITIPGKTRRILLHYDCSKRCAYPVSKFMYAFKVVKFFFKHPVCIIHLWLDGLQRMIRRQHSVYQLTLKGCIRRTSRIREGNRPGDSLGEVQWRHELRRDREGNRIVGVAELILRYRNQGTECLPRGNWPLDALSTVSENYIPSRKE
jgi:hypothetical protein